MKITTCPFILQALVCLATAPTAFAQTSAGSMLYTPTIDLSSGPQNTFAGTVGGVFLTTYSLWPSVNWLGYYDKDGDGLANSHTVALWDGANNLLGSVTVPAGTSAPLVNGYRWAPLPSTVGLTYGSWYVIGAQADGVDTWGDLITKGNNQISWNAEYAEVSNGWDWTRAGRYDNNWPATPSGQTSATDSIYPAANLGYNIVVPEPTSLTVLGLGAALFFANNAIKRKR